MKVIIFTRLFKKRNLTALKAFLHPIFMVASGVLSGTLVVEITNEGRLLWGSAFKAYSFWLLMIFVIVNGYYIKHLYGEEVIVSNFKDKEYCWAYIRSRNIPALAERYNTLLKEGRGIEELIEIENQLHRWLNTK